MSTKEYFDAAPGQRVKSPDSYWKGSQPAPLKTKPGSQDDYISPNDTTFPLTNFPSSYATTGGGAVSPPPKPIPVPHPKRHSTNHVQSPPAPESPKSQVTDESDDSLVHINPPPRERERERELPPPPVSTTRRSDTTLSLTHSNLHQHNVYSSGITTPLRGDYTGISSTRKRLRAKELATHGKDTLVQMLIKQESSTDESRKLLRNALDKLEQYKLDMLEANNHCRRLERACQKLTDERMLMHTQLAEAVGKAQQQILAAQQELSICKLRLEHTEQALTTAQVDLRETRLQRDTAKADAERVRNEAHRLREENNVQLAREQGRKQGFDEGVQHGRVVGVNRAGVGSPPRLITQAGELGNTTQPEISIVVGEGIEEANTSAATQSTNRVRSSSSRADRNSVGSSSRDRTKQEFEEALERVRKETEDRLQHDLEARLEQERQRMEILNLQQQHQREREAQEERDRMKRVFDEAEKARLAQRSTELQALERRLREEMSTDQDKVRKLQQEKEKERALREREQREREREREEREKERIAERERLDRERKRLDREREKERELALQRDRERDRAVAEATRQAAEATANAIAAAASATRPPSEASGSDHESSGMQRIITSQAPVPPLPYIPMPRPPMEMPMPNIPNQSQSTIIPASMSMPEPIVNPLVNTRPHSRSATQPNLPTTVPVRQTRNRRYSVDSQSSLSTVTGPGDSLLSFPYPTGIPGRTPSSGSTRGAGVSVVPGVPGSTGSNGHGRSSSMSAPRGGIYTRPYVSSSTSGGSGTGGVSGPYSTIPGSHVREVALDGIPEDDSVRASPAFVVPPLPILNMPTPSTNSGRGSGMTERREPQQPPSLYSNPMRGIAGGNGNHSPVIPTIHVDEGGDGPGWRDGESLDRQQPINAALLNPRSGGLHRSDSANSNRPSIRSNSSYEIYIEPPSNPTSPRETRTEEPAHEHQPPNQYLSPLHATVPIPPPQPPLPVRPPGNSSGRHRTGGRSRGEDEETPTEPNSPVIPSADAQALPPGFVPQMFTPLTGASRSLSPAPDLSSGLPPGFVPQTITDSVTGMTTPLTGMTGLPGVSLSDGTSVGATTGGRTSSQTQSIYGNPNSGGEDRRQGGTSERGGIGSASAWGSGVRPRSPYTSSSALPSEPPVIPGSGFGGDSEYLERGASGTGWPDPSQRARSIYGNGTPGAGSSRNLPGSRGGTPVGGGVYQNPLRQEDDDDVDADDLVARNTKINATAPAPQLGRKKKKKGGK